MYKTKIRTLALSADPGYSVAVETKNTFSAGKGGADMEKEIRDEQNGLEYELHGDYYLPKLRPPESPRVGRYGRLHLKYLRDNKDAIYTGLLLSGKLNSYLAELDASAEAEFERIVKLMAKQQGVTEKLKATDQMKWVGLMNNIRHCADEQVLHDFVYQ